MITNQVKVQKSSQIIAAVLLVGVILSALAVVIIAGGLIWSARGAGDEVDSFLSSAKQLSACSAGDPMSRREFKSRLQSGLGYALIGGVIIAALYLIFRDISRAETPFTLVNVNRMRSIAWLVIVFSLARGFLEAWALKETYCGLHLNIDGWGLLLGGIIFCLARIFAYGHELQVQSDETL